MLIPVRREHHDGQTTESSGIGSPGVHPSGTSRNDDRVGAAVSDLLDEVPHETRERVATGTDDRQLHSSVTFFGSKFLLGKWR